ncbi:MAG: MGMT family protein, partial [Candidatus Handelsmanbacteria bacterium]|nr:MGMT family protein [Candidatus Handelsmanbacteria bacterium]
PWHRVINAKGEVSPRTWSNMHEFQQVLLEREGIVFKGARLDMKQYRWNPEAP